MKFDLILLACLLTTGRLQGQLAYTDRGHWIGLRTGYVPAGPSEGLAGIAMYEYRFHKNVSTHFDISVIQFPSGPSFILGAALRFRVPVGLVNKNIYGLVGFGSGSLYPVLYLGGGFEYGFTKGIAAVIQYRSYTANFDYLAPTYGIWSLGVNFNITSSATYESYLMDDK